MVTYSHEYFLFLWKEFYLWEKAVNFQVEFISSNLFSQKKKKLK